MKPMGAITKYYPFLDTEAQSLIDSVMEEASNYYEFVLHLGELVAQEEVSLPVAFFAASHAWWTRAIDTSKRIMNTYPNEPLIQVWRFMTITSHSDSVQQYADFEQAYETALLASPAPWMLIELYLLYADFILKTQSALEVLEHTSLARSLIEHHPELDCFAGWMALSEIRQGYFEGTTSERVDECRRAAESAQTCSDVALKYQHMLLMANILKHADNRAGIEAFERVHEIAEELGVPYFRAEVLNGAGLAYAIAGEYDLAIESIHSAEELNLSEKGYIDTSCHILSHIYSSLGKGEEALKWIDKGFEYLEGESVSFIMHFRRAKALLLLGRHEEAEAEIDLGHKHVMKKGAENSLGYYYLISGIHEIVLGNHHNAIETLKQALEIFERVRNLRLLSEALMALAKAEMAIAKSFDEGTGIAVFGQWMTRLEKHAHAEILPGISMQAAIMKADLLIDRGFHRDAREILADALKISDSLGVRTLRKMINDRMEDLNHLLQET